jgi:uncharacterized protein YvpB
MKSIWDSIGTASHLQPCLDTEGHKETEETEEQPIQVNSISQVRSVNKYIGCSIRSKYSVSQYGHYVSAKKNRPDKAAFY